MLHPIPILVIMESREPGFDWVQACSSLQMPLLHNMPLTYCTLWWLWGSYDSLFMLAHNGTNKGFVSAIRCSCHKQVFKYAKPSCSKTRSANQRPCEVVPAPLSQGPLPLVHTSKSHILNFRNEQRTKTNSKNRLLKQKYDKQMPVMIQLWRDIMRTCTAVM